MIEPIPADVISDQEVAKRQEIIDFAKANVELEGFYLDAETLRLCNRFIDGEIDIDTFVKEGLTV